MDEVDFSNDIKNTIVIAGYSTEKSKELEVLLCSLGFQVVSNLSSEKLNNSEDLVCFIDNSNLELLDYLQSVDSNLNCMLVYDNPVALINEDEIFNSNYLKTFMEQWKSYNVALLDFYNKHTANSIMIHSDNINEDNINCVVLSLKRLCVQKFTNLKSDGISEVYKQNLQSKFKNLDIKLLESQSEFKSVLELYNKLQHSADKPKVESLDYFLNQYFYTQEEIKGIDKNAFTIDNEILKMQLNILQDELERYAEKQPTKDQLLIHRELKEENTLLHSQLEMLQVEIQRYIEQRPIQKKISRKPYGASDRIKQQLSYRLGALMVQHSKSVEGIIKLPILLVLETRIYRKERRLKEKMKLPPIHEYADALDAEHIKTHLSYQLGQVLLKNIRTPIGFFKLPWEMKKTYENFKKNKEVQ